MKKIIKYCIWEAIANRALNKINSDSKNKRGHQIAIYANECIGNSVVIDGYYERLELDLIFDFLKPLGKQFFNGVALDIGANVGNHSLYFSRLFNKVFSYEPHPITYKLLEVNAHFAKNSNIKTFNIGIGNESKMLKFQENRDNMGASHICTEADTESSTFEISVNKLDVILGNDNESLVSFLKIDVEGFESEVLLGAEAIINNFRPVIAIEQLEDDFVLNTTRSIEILRTYGYYFYVIERNNKTVKNVIDKFINLYRNLSDKNYLEIIEVETPEKRDHSLIICVPSEKTKLLK